ncbi:replication initiator protein A [Leuconostoc citreum]|uniref:replication initiator protein A n=1 Tax=Leuconostoc citreum TaxID=33964 RepID=UPI00200A831C|nr:replication initiator protein A [Leuconostoc citreum]MCK8605715.1 replication initiator protein A [Leuconostoc citreum]
MNYLQKWDTGNRISQHGTNDIRGTAKMNRININQVETSERFVSVPLALFENEKYKTMKPESKLAYGLLKRRFQLSLKNGWVDCDGNVYFIYKNKELQNILQAGEKKVIAIKKELNAYGLLEEKRQGLNKPNLIYIGNVEIENTVIHRGEPLGDKELSKRQYRNCQNDSSRTVKTTVQEQSKRQSRDTYISDTKYSEPDSIKPIDDDDDINITHEETKSESSEVDSLVETGKLLELNIDLRPLVHEIIPDLLVDEQAQALKVVQALVQAKHYLLNELALGNTMLNQRQIIRGDDNVISLLTVISKKQIAYMHEHLVNVDYYGSYFESGIKQRLKVAITTDKYIAGF